ncbi:MAG: bifunctional riboflavin kinase/FAD synthetase [Anaerolineales bacterium]
MQHYWSLENVTLDTSWLSIGTFDGVHLGHQEIIRTLTQGAHADHKQAVVVTFFPHPAMVLGKKEGRYYLSTPEERAEDLGNLGVDIVITHPFNLQVAQLSAEEFLTRIKEKLNFSNLLVGYDFALGKNREGNVEKLKELSAKLNYSLRVIPALRVDGQIVSSSLLRKMLTEGKIEVVNRFLGRPFRLQGAVITGDGRGRTLGIPTANLEILAERLVPLEGVYVCKAKIHNQLVGAVVNVGVRPTFEENPVAPRVEAHLLDFNEDIYGETISLEFHHRLREERKFPSRDALIEQIQTDIQQARQYLNS